MLSVNDYASNGNEDQYLRYDADDNLEKTLQEQMTDVNCKVTLVS